MSVIHTPRTVRTLANGYGLAQAAIRQARIVAQIIDQIALDPATILVVEEYGWVEFYNCDDDYEDHREHHKVYRKTLKQIVEKSVANGNDYNLPFDEIDSIEGLSSTLGNDEQITVTVMTVEAYDKRKKEERRKELESTASDFARECGHSVGTREFVKSAKEKIAELDYESERWNSGECKMERYANYYHSGSRDAYWSDNDYQNGKFADRSDRLSKVLDYMRENFPLLMLHIEQEEATSDDGDD